MLDGRARDAQTTYRYLRWLLVCLPSLLFIVTVATAIQQGQLEPSISAYYGGPVRDVFVGSMIAIAACLVVYQGRGLEDYTLNGAGYYAVFVALVPTDFEEMMAELRDRPTPDGFTPADHVWILRFALTSVLLVCAVLFVRGLRGGNVSELYTARPEDPRSQRLTRAFVVLTMLVLTVFTVLAMGQLWLIPADEVTMAGLTLGPVQLRVHDLAALFMIVALMVAVLTKTGWLDEDIDVSRADRVAYRVILVLMVLGPVVAGVASLLLAPGHLVIFLEWWEIALFAVFWAKETVRLSRRPERTRPSDAPYAAGPEGRAAD